jgi:succinate dehydrogenase/fumarate reductase flavoprotein subunit
MSHDTEYIDTDILIVGSECAGARAAIEAREHGLNVAVVTKGKISKSGATLTAAADIDVDSRSALLLFNQRGDERDSPEIFFEDVVKEGKYLNNQELVEIMVREAPLRVKEMVEWGMRISNLIKAPGHRYPRGL